MTDTDTATIPCYIPLREVAERIGIRYRVLSAMAAQDPPPFEYIHISTKQRFMTPEQFRLFEASITRRPAKPSTMDPALAATQERVTRQRRRKAAQAQAKAAA